jgi:hypothetical protein
VYIRFLGYGDYWFRPYGSNGYVLNPIQSNPIQRFLKSKAEYSPARSQPNGGGAFESMMPKNR